MYVGIYAKKKKITIKRSKKKTKRRKCLPTPTTCSKFFSMESCIFIHFFLLRYVNCVLKYAQIYNIQTCTIPHHHHHHIHKQIYRIFFLFISIRIGTYNIYYVASTHIIYFTYNDVGT